ncbi:MAG: hypothetical protein R3F61_13450 [Myxococcota bacterium]
MDQAELGFRCSESWASMGSGRVRHCDSCDIDVTDLEGFTRQEAIAWASRRADPAGG